MKRATLIVALAALLAAALPALARAYTPPQVTTMRLAVEITGIHLVDWHYQSTADLASAESWTVGSGAQTLGFQTPKPLPYRAIISRGRLPGGQPLEPLQLQPLSAKRLPGSLRRRGSFRYRQPPPCGEGQCSGSAPVVRVARGSCPALKRQLPVGLEVTRPGGGAPALTVTFSAADLESPWANCAPDLDGSRNNLSLAQPRAVFLAKGVDRIAQLRRGGKLTLKGSVQLGAGDGRETKDRCPPLSGAGMKQCAVTDVTVEVTRVR